LRNFRYISLHIHPLERPDVPVDGSTQDNFGRAEVKEHAFMRLSLATCAQFLSAIVLISVTLQVGLARERGPRVDVVCPAPPIPVKVEDKQVLVYELQVTNFDTVPLTLKKLQVFADTDKSPPLKTISDAALSAIMTEAGTITGGKDSQTIGPAKRAVVFLWIEIGSDQRIPASLSHRMVFVAGTPGEGGAAAETTLEDFPVAVSQDAVPLLTPPFAGVWAAGDGPSNDSGHRRSIAAIDGHIHSPERFAIDWVKVGPNGDSHNGTSRNENWWGYGEPILSVADGEVTQIVDGIPENTPRVLPKPVTLDNIAGNYVIVRIASNRYATFAHLQPGSIKVRLHEHVRRGDVLGRLGNSGNATGPHLHFQVTDGNSVLQSEGVPFIFDKFTYLGPGSDYEVDKHPSIPRERSIPGDNDVVEFPPAKK
jgi:murein DD-endopeptidase